MLCIVYYVYFVDHGGRLKMLKPITLVHGGNVRSREENKEQQKYIKKRLWPNPYIEEKPYYTSSVSRAAENCTHVIIDFTLVLCM